MKPADQDQHLFHPPDEHILKGTATLKASESEMHALLQTYNLPQTLSKSDVKQESYSSPKFKILTYNPTEAAILNI